MLFRAIFWIGLVSVLLPREPDLELGRPAASYAFGGTLSSAVDALTAVGTTCEGKQTRCSSSSSAVESWQTGLLDRLAQIKADIEAQERARAARAG